MHWLAFESVSGQIMVLLGVDRVMKPELEDDRQMWSDFQGLSLNLLNPRFFFFVVFFSRGISLELNS